MILPPDYTAAGPATSTLTYSASSPSPTSLIPKYGSEEWSSLIGIITAIVGNILISFALNTQRYAHIRLEREWQEKERLRKKRSASYRNSRRKYHPPRHAEYTVESERDAVDEGAVATEADPLLPNVASSQGTTHSRSRPTLKTTNTSTTDDGTTEEAYKQKSYLKSPYWWAGIILMTTGEAGNFLAYGFAPASIVSPLGVVALISNCIIAPFMLKEPFRARDGIGVIVAVAGAVTVVASASDNNPKLGPDEIWDLITTWEFETYLGITIAVIMALMAASNKFGEKSILIDLGLVGLFGMDISLPCSLNGIVLTTWNRWLHGPFNQRSCLYAFLYPMACHHVSSHLPPRRHSRFHRYYANQVRQSSAPAFRRHASHPRSVRSLHSLSHPWLCNLVPRLRTHFWR